ncbi:hypothetical protein M0Q50_10265 [bacterium]|jgi:hypothetical protein|nr:hypothetical protein [bacterium]
MGYIKQKLFDLAEQVAEGLNKGNNKNNIGKYMFKLLNSEDYDFFVENRQYILELAETLTDVEDNYYKVDSADEKISNNDDYDPASMYENFNKSYIMPSIFKKSNINEGCNCNGTKPKPKPRPKSRPK